MRARPAGAGLIVRLHDFARGGPTKEAHRRALNRPDTRLVGKWGGRAYGAMTNQRNDRLLPLPGQHCQKTPLTCGFRARGGIRTPNRQIRSLVLCVGLDGSRPIWPAHVRCLVDLVGSRPVPSDRLDDQPDDQTGGDVLTLIPLPGRRWTITGRRVGSQPVKLGAPRGVKRRRRWSARRDTGTARRSGRLGAPQLGSRAGEAAAPHGRWSAPAVKCSTGQRAGRGGGRPPTRQPGRAGPGRCRGYGPRRGRTRSGCGHLGPGAGWVRPGVRPAGME
jgi:hypothetical protein